MLTEIVNKQPGTTAQQRTNSCPKTKDNLTMVTHNFQVFCEVIFMSLYKTITPLIAPFADPGIPGSLLDLLKFFPLYH